MTSKKANSKAAQAKKNGKAPKDAKSTQKPVQNAKHQDTPVFKPLGQYIKDFSFECPHSPILAPATQQDMDLSLGVNIALADEENGLYEVIIAMKALAKTAKEETIFIAELAYAGVFQVQNIAKTQSDALLHVDAAALLYPFARQAFMGIMADAGFRPPILDPINFGALYQQRNQEKSNT